MSITPAIPSFDIYLEDLNQFIFELVDAYHARKIESWGDLEAKVNVYFTPERMEHTENLVPGWRKMASYAERVTLVHVMCVFLGLYMMPEFLSMTKEQQQMMKWVILFHDIEKNLKKRKGITAMRFVQQWLLRKYYQGWDFLSHPNTRG